MKFRRIFTPAILIVTLLVQFLPGTVFAPRPAAASACDAAQFVADVTIPDGTSFAPGSALVKTWRFKNIGSCTWSTSYSIVFYSGTRMGAASPVYMPTSVAPGATVDVTVNMTAPSSPGHYRGYWMLRNASSVLFGVGPYGTYWFFIDIVVGGGSSSTAYDFVANYCSATWSSGAGALPCPGTDGDSRGFVQKVDAPMLETGVAGPAGLLTFPQNLTGGYIQGVYPAFAVQSGDHFQSIINCLYGSTGCYVTFQLQYQIGSGSVNTLKTFNEKLDGMYYNLDINLSSLAGQNVKFILKVSAPYSPAGDRAIWSGARITRFGGGGGTPPPPSTTCDKAWFVSDVTIPDGTVISAGAPFTKTWRLQNVGSCTWTTAYKLVFVGWDLMGASATSYNLPSSVAPGGTIDLSVNLTAPSAVGNYYGYWILQNASGVNFGVGASGTSTFFVNIRVLSSGSSASTTTITADAPDPSLPSQAVAVSVTVSGAGVTPTGTVAITGANTNCTITLVGGSGSCNVMFTSTGAKTLTATYSGDVNYATSSGTMSHTVSSSGLAASTTVINSDVPDSSTPAQAVTVNVTVSGAGLTPTGTVAITGANTNCTITLAGGNGSCNVVFSTTGAKTLTATYSGDSNYATSSDTESHTVATATAASATTINSTTPDPSTPGQAVVVSVTVSGAGIPTPTGTVTITGQDSGCAAPVVLDGTGHGTCSVTFTTVGAKTLTATYSGDITYASSLGTASHTVNKGSTTTTITSDLPDPSIPTQAIPVNVTVFGGGVAPSGTVTITGADINCTITLAGGSGSCNVVFNTIGAKTITATYNGDGNYFTSVDTETHTVKNVTTTTITLHNPDPSTPGAAVTVNFNVSGAGIPTGTVTITGQDSGCAAPVALDGAGNGTCSVTFTTAGAKILTATYSGDGTYAASSGTASHTVSKGASLTVISSPVAPEPSLTFQSVLVTVTMWGAGVTPTGSVAITLSGGETSTCNITLAAGTGSCNVVFTTVGTFSITATYSGDGNYNGSVDNETHVVN